MHGLESLLQAVLVGLLAFTLWHAVRLERALGVLRRDRTALDAALSGLNSSTRDTEAGLVQLRHLAEGAAEQVTSKMQAAGSLRDDLAYLTSRGEALADRLETLVRAGRPTASGADPRTASNPPQDDPAARGRSQAERDLMQAMRSA